MSHALRSISHMHRRGLRRSWRRLLTLTGTDPYYDPRTLAERLHARRIRLVRVLVVVSLPLALALDQWLFASLPLLGGGVLTLLLLVLLAAALNRQGLPEFAASLLLAVLMGMIARPFFLGGGEMTALSLLRYGFFVIPIAAAGFTIHRRAPLVFGGVAVCVVFGDALWQPRAPTLLTLFGQHGWVVVMGQQVLLLSVVAIFSWLAERTMEREIVRADRADVLAEAEEQIAEQEKLLARKHYEVETGMAVLQQTMTQLGSGDFTARARLQENPLMPLAVSLNLLMDRLQRMSAVERRYEQLELAVLQMAQSLEKNATGGLCPWPPASRTVADRLRLAIGELESARMRQLRREVDEIAAAVARVARWEGQATPFFSGGFAHSRSELTRLSERVYRLQVLLSGATGTMPEAPQAAVR